MFDVVQDPLALEEALRPHIKAGDTARLLATFGVEWKSQPPGRGSRRAPSRAGLTPFDFDIEFKREGRLHRWEKIWNAVPGGDDYTVFVQALPGTAMEQDPLAEERAE